MNAKRMIRLCNAAAKQLVTLESLLSYIPARHGADRFVYTSIGEVAELRHIARLETARNVTVEQAAHIQHILSKIKQFMRHVPDSVRKDLDGPPGNP